MAVPIPHPRAPITAVVPTAFALDPAPASAQDHERIAREVLRAAPLVDGHNDLPWAIREDPVARGDVRVYDLRARTRGQTDLDRLRRGMVGGQIWSVYVPCEAAAEPGRAPHLQREQIALARAMIAHYPEAFGFALDDADVERTFRVGRIASLLGMEGGTRSRIHSTPCARSTSSA
jgi:membrane dipeptidase